MEESEESDDEFNGEDYEEMEESESESDDEGKPTKKKKKKSKMSQIHSQRYTIALAKGDTDHGLVEGHARKRAEHGHHPSDFFDEALDLENEDVIMPEHQTEEHPDNIIIVKNQRVVAVDIGYKSYEARDGRTVQACAKMRAKLVLYQLPTEDNSRDAYSRIKLMPYTPISQWNPYRPDMEFRFKCPFFYRGGREQVEKLRASY